ncbi:4Fe-4S binding protein [uncultured Enorma sp.]|uniref:4Fe-4S binding protein n=1 Tax=uncultured Enorma sp. TaxID=1714346 RepID=UPI0025965428|nr:4Fe-4S binding protein [uncultured Enorma sp.]
MKTMQDVYRLFDAAGCCSFATLDGAGGVESRIAHFFAYDDEGLYLRTMRVKPFYRQLKEGRALSVSAEKTAAPCTWDDDNMPHFQPGYMVRVSGTVRELTQEEVDAKAADNPLFNVAVYDIAKYPETVVFVLDRFHGEYYDYDFNMVHRDHKIQRERFAFGGDAFEEPGLSIDPFRCIGCGDCARACTHKAIAANPSGTMLIIGERCDECGNCYHVCPTGAVASKGTAAER